MDFVNAGLRQSNLLINSKIDEVLTVDLTLRELVASWPLAASMTLSNILTYLLPASFVYKENSSGAIAAQSILPLGHLHSPK
jgi:hypothetical protein